MVETNDQRKPDYEVGYKRPPKSTQFKPGQRGNPNGRPRGSRNLKTIVLDSLKQKIPVRRGDKSSKVEAIRAVADTFVIKAAQGDAKAAGVLINLATKTGAFNAGNELPSRGSAPIIVPGELRNSERLIESVDPNLLSQEEQIELSKLAERMDDAGDAMALDDGDLLRLKQIVGKGWGQGVAPKADDALKEVA
jgi:hypothetical protein